MEQDQARTPDGRFSYADRRDESGQVVVIDMWEDSGTYEYPPRPRSAEHLINFWRNVEIPEAVARQVEAGFAEWTRKAARLASYAASDAYKEELSKPSQFDEAEDNRRRQAAYDYHMKKAPTFEQGHLYPCIRGACMYRDSKYLPEDERAIVENVRIRLPGGKIHVTPKQIWDTCHFAEYADALRNPETMQLEELRRLREHLEAIQAATVQTNNITVATWNDRVTRY